MNDIINSVYLTAGLAVCLFFGMLYITSLRERKLRAAIISSVLFALIGSFFCLFFIFNYHNPTTLLIPVIVIILFAAIFFLPLKKSSVIKINKITKRVDERNCMFSREDYVQGTDNYQKYYEGHPDKKEMDNKIRALPALLAPGARYYDSKISPKIEKMFELNRAMTVDVDGPVNPDKIAIDQTQITDKIKQMALELGADEVGICKLNPMYVYSHVGRGPEEWGSEIVNNHKYAIMFTMEMRYDYVETAPKIHITLETAINYLKGARISIKLAQQIRGMGYPARAQIAGSNYQIMLPPVAYEAGLGELGRHGYLISAKYGSRIRLGAVTTDLPLETDSPVNLGVQDFCEKCKKCAHNCPSHSIPNGAKSDILGVEKWPLNQETCMHYWRVIGTDCGLCMKVCPFSHPPSLVHNLIRTGIKNSSIARTLSIWADDLFYGKKAKH